MKINKVDSLHRLQHHLMALWGEGISSDIIRRYHQLVLTSKVQDPISANAVSLLRHLASTSASLNRQAPQEANLAGLVLTPTSLSTVWLWVDQIWRDTMTSSFSSFCCEFFVFSQGFKNTCTYSSRAKHREYLKPNSDEIEWSCHMQARSQTRCSSLAIDWCVLILSIYKGGKIHSQAPKLGNYHEWSVHKQCSWLCTMNTNAEDRRSTYRYIQYLCSLSVHQPQQLFRPTVGESCRQACRVVQGKGTLLGWCRECGGGNHATWQNAAVDSPASSGSSTIQKNQDRPLGL